MSGAGVPRTTVRKRLLWGVSMLASLLAVGTPARAVIVFEKGNPVPIRGYLVQQSEASITIQIRSGEGVVLEERIITRLAIEDLIIAVDPERLAALRPKEPTDYRDYAEELAEKREDPEARDTAIRLYLIAAYQRPQELGRSSLLGMTALARTPAEERRFRAMAFLLGDGHDPSLLARPTTTAAEAVGFTEDERRMLRSLFRLIRARRTDDARRLLNGAEVPPLLPRLATWVTAAELQAVTAPDSTLSPPLLRQLLSLEIALSGGSPSDAGETGKAIEPWSQVIARGGVKPVAELTLESLTEFDPRQNVFRERRWTAGN